MGTNYGRGIINQIEDLTVQNDRLMRENKQLRAENRELRAQLKAIESSMEARIAAAVQKALTPLIAELSAKDEKITKLASEVDRLKAQIGKNSGNSSKPPGQDGFKRIPNSREPSSRKSGGQTGHPGKRLELPENLDELVEKGLARCELVDHTNGASLFATRFTIDIDITVVVTEHRYLLGSIPLEHRTEVTYGSRIKALAALLSTEGIIAEERLSDFFKEITHGAIKLSDATIEKFLFTLNEKLAPELSAIKTSLLNETVLHIDETPMRCTQKPDYRGEECVLRKSEGTSFNVYIRTHSGETATLYTVNPQKDDAGINRDGLLPQYIGIISQDHEAKFYHYGTAHATCGAHLLRELRGMFELQKITWANEMRQFIADINDYKNKDMALGSTFSNLGVLAGFDRRYDELIDKGHAAFRALKEKELGYDELRRMLKRLTQYKDCYLLFIRDYRAPFTNNLAERDLRPCKTKQKVSGCFRSWAGIERYARG